MLDEFTSQTQGNISPSTDLPPKLFGLGQLITFVKYTLNLTTLASHISISLLVLHASYFEITVNVWMLEPLIHTACVSESSIAAKSCLSCLNVKRRVGPMETLWSIIRAPGGFFSWHSRPPSENKWPFSPFPFISWWLIFLFILLHFWYFSILSAGLHFVSPFYADVSFSPSSANLWMLFLAFLAFSL